MSHITNRERRKLGRVQNKILHDRYLFSLWKFLSKDCQAQSVTEEATVGLPLDSTLAVWNTVTAAVKVKISQECSASEGPNGAQLSTQLWLTAALM